MTGHTSRASNEPIALSASGIHCRFGDVTALDGVSLDIAAGSAVALVGESGSGKTTLLRCFNRMVLPQSGDILVGGLDVQQLRVEVLRRSLGYVPQHGGLLPHWTVLRNVALVPSLLGSPAPLDAGREALELVGLSPDKYSARFPHQLSGGQRQRVAFARAVAARPGALLLDEPFGALDAITRSDVQSGFSSLRSALGVTTLLVTHDLAEAARLATELVVLRAGRIEQRGTLHDLRHAPATPYVETLVATAMAAFEGLRAS